MVLRFKKENFKLETLDRISYQLVIMEGAFTVKHLVDVKKVITEYLDLGITNIIFDLKNVERMDSSAIGMFGNVYKRLNKISGTLGVLNPSSAVFRVLRETALDKVVKLFTTVQSIDDYFEI